MNLVAKWLSSGGRYTCSLFRDGTTYVVQSDAAGGVLPQFQSDVEAIGYMEEAMQWGDGKRRVDLYQPDTNITPMKRVYW